MSKEMSQTVTEVMNSLEGVELKERQGRSFRFRMYMTNEMMNSPLDVLDLGVRAYHCLMRAGYKTVGQVADAVASKEGIGSIRNCGKKSVREIKEHLFLFNYNNLDVSRRDSYLKEVVLMNIGFPEI